MLKFAVDSKVPGAPSYVGLGLSHENLRRLRADAIQFHGSDVGLGSGVFVIAHIDDPQLGAYQALLGADVCELLILTERVCRQFETGAPLVNIPLKSMRGGQPCEALVFAGETEQVLLDALKAKGLVTPATSVVGPDTPATSVVELDAPVAAEPASVFGVAAIQRIKLAGGGLGFLAITAMLAARPRMEGWALLLMFGTALVFLALLALRWSERVEIDADEIRCRRPLGGFAVRWRDVASIAARSDSLGPFELHIETRSGETHKLRRIYARWDELVRAISK